MDMFSLIFKGLSDYEDYDIEEDTGIFLCPNKNYKDRELLFEECYEECSIKDSCNKEYVKVDLSIFVPWWASDEDGGTIYINFNQKAEKKQYRNTIRYVNYRKQLIELMYEMKQRVDKMKNAYAEYAEKIIELRKYGENFLLEVQKDYPVFGDIQTDLPIVFDDFDKDENGQYRYDTGGNFCVNDIQLIIHVYDCWRELEDLKTTVRHEILHYLLFRIGVKYSDDDAIFHYLCGIYDAHAYKEMGEEDQGLYDKLVRAIPELEAKCKDDAFKIRLIVMAYCL